MGRSWTSRLFSRSRSRSSSGRTTGNLGTPVGNPHLSASLAAASSQPTPQQEASAAEPFHQPAASAPATGVPSSVTGVPTRPSPQPVTSGRAATDSTPGAAASAQFDAQQGRTSAGPDESGGIPARPGAARAAAAALSEGSLPLSSDLKEDPAAQLAIRAEDKLWPFWFLLFTVACWMLAWHPEATRAHVPRLPLPSFLPAFKLMGGVLPWRRYSSKGHDSSTPPQPTLRQLIPRDVHTSYMLGHLSASLALGAINSSTAAREAGRLLRLRPPVQLQPETLLELGQVLEAHVNRRSVLSRLASVVLPAMGTLIFLAGVVGIAIALLPGILGILKRIAQHLLLPLLRLVLQVLRPFATLIVLSVYYAALLMYPFLYAAPLYMCFKIIADATGPGVSPDLAALRGFLGAASAWALYCCALRQHAKGTQAPERVKVALVMAFPVFMFTPLACLFDSALTGTVAGGAVWAEMIAVWHCVRGQASEHDSDGEKKKQRLVAAAVQLVIFRSLIALFPSTLQAFRLPAFLFGSCVLLLDGLKWVFDWYDEVRLTAGDRHARWLMDRGFEAGLAACIGAASRIDSTYGILFWVSAAAWMYVGLRLLWRLLSRVADALWALKARDALFLVSAALCATAYGLFRLEAAVGGLELASILSRAARQAAAGSS